jgi:nucleoside transporter
MMFIQFFIWGAWFVTVGNYMASVGMTDMIYWAYVVGPVGAIVSPFFLGMIADRFFPTEKVLGVLHLIGGVAIFLAPFMAEGELVSAWLFIILLLIHNLCYMPTIGLVNSLTFHHITDQEKYFPVIRVFGTVGWIVAGIFVSGILGADETAIPLRVAAVASLIMGLYSFTLPHTPPPAAGEEVSVRQIIGLDALSKLKSRPFIVFMVSSFLICIPLAVYYAYAPVFVNALEISNPAFKMSFGQMSEVVFIVLMPFFFAFLGVKWMLFIGMLAWVLRYILFALAAPTGILWMVMGGILLHGICYDFFFVAGQIYVDKKATAEIRGQAQGFLVLVTYGVGMLIGAQISGRVFNSVVNGASTEVFQQWQFFWILPAVFAGVILTFFTMLFNEKKLPKESTT